MRVLCDDTDPGTRWQQSDARPAHVGDSVSEPQAVLTHRAVSAVSHVISNVS